EVGGVDVERVFKRADRFLFLVLSQRDERETVVNNRIFFSDAFRKFIVLARRRDVLQLQLRGASRQQSLLANLCQDLRRVLTVRSGLVHAPDQVGGKRYR